MDEPLSRSHRFFLNLAPDPSVEADRVGFHWKNLEDEFFSADEWTPILMRLNAYTRMLDKTGKQILSGHIEGSASHRLSFTALCDADKPDTVLAATEFFSRHDYGFIPSSFFDDMHKKIEPHLADLPPKDMAVMLRALEASRHIPSARFWRSFQDAWTAKAGLADLSDMEHVYYAAARLALKMRPEMIDILGRNLRENSGDMPKGMRNKAIWSAAVIDCIHGGNVLKDSAVSALESHGLDDSAMRSIVCAWFDIPTVQKKSEVKDTRSRREKRLKEFFARASVHVCPPQERFIPSIASPVDIRLRFGGRDIIVEMDGITHFNFEFGGKPHYNGSTLFMTAVKSKMAPGSALLHVDYLSCDTLFNHIARDRQAGLAGHILTKARDLPDGSYRLTIAADSIRFDEMSKLGGLRPNRL